MLAEIKDQEQNLPDLQEGAILRSAAKKLGIHDNPTLEQAVLTQWAELFRTGILAWGLNLPNPGPPFFHLTESGRQALQNLTRDPSNPDGYLRHLNSIASVDLVVLSYLREGLDCYVAGLFKAAAVMVGGAVERLILVLRDAVVQELTAQGVKPSKDLTDWKVKTVSNALRKFFDARQDLPHELREEYEAYWSAFAQQIRAARNDAGHPVSVDPVTPDAVHASLLVFPELAKLGCHLAAWVNINVP